MLVFASNKAALQRKKNIFLIKFSRQSATTTIKQRPLNGPSLMLFSFLGLSSSSKEENVIIFILMCAIQSAAVAAPTRYLCLFPCVWCAGNGNDALCCPTYSMLPLLHAPRHPCNGARSQPSVGHQHETALKFDVVCTEKTGDVVASNGQENVTRALLRSLFCNIDHARIRTAGVCGLWRGACN